MSIEIHSERVSDYNSIAKVNYQAFHNWHPNNQFVCEPILVDLLRHSSYFDPELSLVAEVSGEVVGHVLFTPFKYVVLGVEQMGVILAPIAVSPSFQREGIGKMLIEEGHKRARAKGFTFSLLCGHESYYPRFGYRTEMFSVSGSTVRIVQGGFSDEGFSNRPVNEQDIPWILEAWKNQHGCDSLALWPGDSISDWCNHGVECRSSVICSQQEILAFVRYVRSNPLGVKEVLARDEDIARILQYLAQKQEEISVYLPADKLKQVLDANHFRVIDKQKAHKAFMIRVLEPESLMAKYCSQVEAGSMQPGIIVFPSIFDVDDGVVD